MAFHTFPPPVALLDVVETFYTVESGSDKALRSFNTVADGLPGLMVRLPGGSTLVDSDHGAMAQAFIYGQATTCRTLTAQGSLHALGIFFKPHALHSVFALNANELTDACFDLANTGDGIGRVVCDQLAKATTTEACIEMLTSYLVLMAERNSPQRDEQIISSVQAIVEAHGDVAVHAIAQKVGLSERTLERRFKRTVGLTPRLFARIRRFQRTLHLLRSGEYTKLSDIAYASDYADQSHYIRSFKEFTGISPLEFRRDGNEVIENFLELPPE
ncbi:MAG: AraC family transcriptional regulator [Flavobacteriales bacterium]|nr:AraC family transcriptional regulator [Flavobacteriales bacterium]